MCICINKICIWSDPGVNLPICKYAPVCICVRMRHLLTPSKICTSEYIYTRVFWRMRIGLMFYFCIFYSCFSVTGTFTTNIFLVMYAIKVLNLHWICAKLLLVKYFRVNKKLKLLMMNNVTNGQQSRFAIQKLKQERCALLITRSR